MTAAVLDVARSWLGTKEDPPGSNHCGITEWYADTSRLEWTRSGNPWCDMSVSKWLSDAGLPTLYAYCPTHVNAFKSGAAGEWIGGKDPRPGDVVFFDWNHDYLADHVGLVEVVNSDGTVTTIEGNTGDAVRRQIRSRAVILGFGRPKYHPDPAPIPAPPIHEEDDDMKIIKRPDGNAFLFAFGKLTVLDDEGVLHFAAAGTPIVDQLGDKSWRGLTKAHGEPIAG